jgi:hypothetical protein
MVDGGVRAWREPGIVDEMQIHWRECRPSPAIGLRRKASVFQVLQTFAGMLHCPLIRPHRSDSRNVDWPS